MSLHESVAELWEQVARQRAAKGDMAGLQRAATAAGSTRLAQHWRTSGWSTPGGAESHAQRQGRSWRDADRPSKLP